MTRESLKDREILEAALFGLQLQLTRVDDAISGIQSQLGHRGPGRPIASTDGAQSAPRKRTMSAAARKRIGEATRKRWAALRKAKAVAEKPAEKPKRKLSAAGKARIIAATKKRWAAFRKTQKAAARKTNPKPKTQKPAVKPDVPTPTTA